MKTYLAVVAGLLCLSGAAHGASAINTDTEAHTLIVTEGGSRSELAIGAGETVEFCAGGCFVTLPNGDREALSGSETLKISRGSIRIK